MITYSRWDPSTGDYDYFESNARPGLNDDLPVPQLPPTTQLGVPSTEAGRPLPADARYIGRGEEAVGVIAKSAATKSLSGTGSEMASPWLVGVAAFAAGVVVAMRFGK